MNTSFPSGPWTGFFLEFHRPERGWMHLYLNFENGRIQGEGTDYVGPWHINGMFSEQDLNCNWIKQYVGQHQVEYTGQCSQQGIVGTWEIGPGYEGKFHIWPSSRGDIQQMYLEQDLPNSQFNPENPGIDLATNSN